MSKPSSSVQHHYFLTNKFFTTESWSFLTGDLPTVRREGTINCQLIRKSGVVRTHANCIVLFLNSMVEGWCLEKQSRWYRAPLQEITANACTISKTRDWGLDRLLSAPQNYLYQNFIVVADRCCFLSFYLRIKLPDKSLSQEWIWNQDRWSFVMSFKIPFSNP